MTNQLGLTGKWRTTSKWWKFWGDYDITEVEEVIGEPAEFRNLDYKTIWRRTTWEERANIMIYGTPILPKLEVPMPKASQPKIDESFQDSQFGEKVVSIVQAAINAAIAGELDPVLSQSFEYRQKNKRATALAATAHVIQAVIEELEGSQLLKDKKMYERRYKALCDWYLNSGRYADINPNGHIERTTQQHLDEWADRQ